MECRYQRELDRNYLVITGRFAENETYALRMVEENLIPGFLKLKVQEINGENRLGFEVTAKQPISRIYERTPMSGAAILALLTSIRRVMEEANQYLLKNTNLIMKPEYIFADADRTQMFFCYVPGSDEEENRFAQLADFVLKHLDPTDPEAVRTGHIFYERVNSGQLRLEQMLEELDGSGCSRNNGSGSGRSRNNEPKKNWEEAGHDEYKTDAFRDELEDEWSASDKQDNKRRPRDKKERREPKETDLVSWILLALLFLILTALYGLAVYWFALDLTQAGALAAALVALLWLIYGFFARRRNRERGIWDDVISKDSQKEEAEFLAALMEEEVIPAEDMFLYGRTTAQKPEPHRPKQKEADEWRNAAFHGRKTEDTEKKEISENTRILGDTENCPKVMLISRDIGRSRDIRIENRMVLIGKKREDVDICIPLDVMSRVHAKLEICEDCCYLEDLNSSNGTYVGEERLEPFERRKISQSGTDIAFANVQYKLVYR